MKHPKLKEVKKYFENAKTIRLANSKVEIEVNTELFKKNKFGVNEYGSNGELLETKNSFHCVYAKDGGYAEILTYKEKTFSITESQINNLKKDIKNGYHVDAIYYLEKLFPEAFESEVKSLPKDFTGWCKIHNMGNDNWLMYFDNGIQQYGIDSNENWFIPAGVAKIKEFYIEATEQEVFEALRGEALKRYKAGQLFYLDQQHDEIGYLKMDEDGFKYYPKDNQFFVGAEKNRRAEVFYQGIWREEIESITLSEAEQQLGKKIIV